MRISARILMVGLSVAMLVVVPDATVRATAQVAQGKATIIGSVVDGSLNPLAGVTVIIERAGQQVAKTVTGADCKFRFADLPAALDAMEQRRTIGRSVVRLP